MSRLRVQFIHGLEGSPQATKAQLFAQHFDACTPAMDTRDFSSCFELHARTLAEFRPDILIGSSFGGAVAVALLQRGSWRGPTLLLAPAVLHYPVLRELPHGVPVWIVHGTADTVVDIADSRALARTGSPELVRLIEVNDDHSLSNTAATSQLVRIVRQLADWYCTRDPKLTSPNGTAAPGTRSTVVRDRSAQALVNWPIAPGHCPARAPAQIF